MITQNRGQLCSRQFGDPSRDLFERLIIWREDGEIGCSVNCFHKASGLQGSRSTRQSTENSSDGDWSWDCQNSVDDVDQATVKFDILPKSVGSLSRKP